MIRIGLFSEDSKLPVLLSSALGKDFQVLWEQNVEGLEHLLTEDRCDVALIDLDSSASSLDGTIAFARKIAASNVLFLVMADDGQRQTAAELVRAGAFGYCRKPPSIADLKGLLKRAHESRRLHKELEDAQQELASANRCGEMIGSSARMKEVYGLIQRVADLNASVLVTGESGSGKELIANAIHNLGSHANKPFVAVSCGAIPETLIEAELFGHEKGSYTSAVTARDGYFEQAGEGTLFLDEIGELTPATQVKLLRVLQQREFSRLGSTRLVPLKARLIFATNQDLGELVSEGKFRLDLYYRINVMKIHAPSLQERIEDIPLLAMHFLKHYSRVYGKDVEGINPGAMAILEGYSWPGNVRELENVIQRCIIVTESKTISEEDLPRNVQDESTAGTVECEPVCSFERQLRDYKIRLAVTAVRENHGNKTLAARSLQISRAYLHRLIRLSESPASAETDKSLEIA